MDREINSSFLLNDKNYLVIKTNEATQCHHCAFKDKKCWLDTKITGNCLSRTDNNYVSFKEIRDEV